MCTYLLVSRKKKQVIFDKWIKTKDENVLRYHTKYNRLYNILIRKSKKMSHEQKFRDKYKDAREMWQYTNQLLARNKKGKMDIVCLYVVLVWAILGAQGPRYLFSRATKERGRTQFEGLGPQYRSYNTLFSLMILQFVTDHNI